MINNSGINRDINLIQEEQDMNTLSDEELFAVSDSIIEQNLEAYTELAS